ncbi:putative membrane protein [Candidatus Protofrankia californiensis]|uniref:Putative membrane protein n=1 Tax=Candidatus Protofrankia californiensis TaxID=1839754 RepID=A0A1C3NT92_9ACTN|nr:putative membrane protein [Candidatus Protofrankia californiensis]
MADGVRRSDAANPRRPGVGDGAPESAAYPDARPASTGRGGYPSASYQNQDADRRHDARPYQGSDSYRNPDFHQDSASYQTSVGPYPVSGGYQPSNGYPPPGPGPGPGSYPDPRAPGSHQTQGAPPQAGYGRDELGPGYGAGAGYRGEPASGGYASPAGVSTPDFYSEQTRLASGARQAGLPPVDPGLRAEEPYREEPYRPPVPRPQARPGGFGGHQPAASNLRQGGHYQPGAPYPPDGAGYPAAPSGPGAYQPPVDFEAGYPGGGEAGAARDAAAAAAAPPTTVGGFPPSRAGGQGGTTGRRPPAPPLSGLPRDPLPVDGPATDDMMALADLRLRQGGDRAERPDGVPPPRTRQAGADMSAPAARRAGSQRSGHRASSSAADQSTGEQVSAVHSDHGRRRDERSSPRSTDRSAEGTGTRQNRPRDAAGVTPLLRRLLYAVVILGVAFALGGGAGFVWQKIGSSGSGDKAGATARPSTVAGSTAGASAGPGASAGRPPAATAAPATVPADWVAVADAQQKAKFSHPPGWKQRRDNTALFFVEQPVGSATSGGLQMVGVARVAASDQAAALNIVQNSEFASQPGLTKDGSRVMTDSSGAQVQEWVGSYLREGQRVTYVMRTLPAGDVVYVLISRSLAESADTATALIGSLRASFSPA